MKKTFRLFVAIVFVALLPSSELVLGGELKAIHSFGFPETYHRPFGGDLAWDGEHLWTTVRDTLEIQFLRGATYEIDPVDGSVVSMIRHDSSPPHFDGALFNRGFTFDGTHVWATQPRAGRDSNDAFVVASPVLPPYEEPLFGLLPYSPDAKTYGAAWDGECFWFSDYKHGVIMRVATDMVVLEMFDSPGNKPLGLAWDGSSLWNVDEADGTIYQLDRSGNVLEAWSSPATRPQGLAFDGQYLWLLDNGTEQIFQLVIPEPGVVMLLLSGAAGLCLLRMYRLRGPRRDLPQRTPHPSCVRTWRTE